MFHIFKNLYYEVAGEVNHAVKVVKKELDIQPKSERTHFIQDKSEPKYDYSKIQKMSETILESKNSTPEAIKKASYWLDESSKQLNK